MISGQMAQKITLDSANNVPIEKSKLKYTEEMKEFRKQIDKEIDDHLAKNPGSIVHAGD